MSLLRLLLLAPNIQEDTFRKQQSKYRESNRKPDYQRPYNDAESNPLHVR